MFAAHGGPWHKFAYGVRWTTLGGLGERNGQPGMRIDTCGLAVFDQLGADRLVVAALFRACEEAFWD